MVEAYSATGRPPAVRREITESSVDGRLKVTNTQVEDDESWQGRPAERPGGREDDHRRPKCRRHTQPRVDVAVRRAASLALAAVLAIGVGVAIFSSVRDRVAAERPAPLTVVRGVIGSEKQPFFQDPQVVAAFARQGLQVQVDTAGSREIATRVDLDKYDFAFPAGIPAAERIRRQRKITAFYQPFYTPMAVATFKPIAEVLARAGVTSPLAGGYWRFDVKRYLELVARETRWNQLPGNKVYAANKSVLIASTDVRTSNSAAMYLAIASYVRNGDRVVENAGQGDRIVGQLAPLFLRQGFSEYSSEGPFEDYLTIGAGKAPMVMVYEAQFLARAAAQDGSIGPDRVLAYPEPTVLTKHTLVPLTAGGDRVGRLLTGDPELQRLAVKWGFRTSDGASVRRYLTERKVTPPPDLVTIVEPPTYEALEHLITRIQQRY
jgi:hypothetical protein